MLIGVFLSFLILISFSYSLIREIIWSIVWCEQGGKYRKIKQLKEQERLWERIKMTYLRKYVSQYKKAFNFWHLFLHIFSVCEIILFLADISLLIFFPESAIARVVMQLFLGQLFLLFLFIVFQFDIKRNTKYDRLREEHRISKHSRSR